MDKEVLTALPYVDGEPGAEVQRLIEDEMRRFSPQDYLAGMPLPTLDFEAPPHAHCIHQHYHIITIILCVVWPCTGVQPRLSARRPLVPRLRLLCCRSLSALLIGRRVDCSYRCDYRGCNAI